MYITKDGVYYRQFLPHYRAPGRIYHCRFSLHPQLEDFRFTEEWMFAAIEDSVLIHHKKLCIVHAYVIMANHAHAVLQPLPIENDPLLWCDYREFYRLECITGKIKGRSARRINQRIGRSGQLWQNESYDRIIRNGRDLENTIQYLHDNPVRWKLVKHAEEYRWSSLRTIYSGEAKYRDWFTLPYSRERTKG